MARRKLDSKSMKKLLLMWGGLTIVGAIAIFVIILVVANANKKKEEAAQMTSPQPSSGEVAAQGVMPTPTVAGAEGEAAAEGEPTTPGSPVDLGGQVPGFIANADLMKSAGMTWVKYQIKWNPSVSAADANTLIQQGHTAGFKVLLSISGDSYPTSIDYASFIAYLGQVASYQPDAIEVWNEMNLDREWPKGQISGESYVTNMLAPAYNAIKTVSPNTMVITGALAPTGANIEGAVMSDDLYVPQMAAAGAANYADCIGVHHNSGTTSPTARTGHVSDGGDGHYSWYYLPTIEVYYNGMNQALPICLTEFGYLTPDGISEPLPEIFSWGANTTIAQQAQWLAEGVNIAEELGYVDLVIIWNVDFTNWGENDPFMGYAIIRPDGSCPACQTLAAEMAN
jgi:hypothetical protein